MYILGIQGSPRREGNTSILLTRFLSACRERGAITRERHVMDMEIQPCRELRTCEDGGICPLADDMNRELYGELHRADVVVLASPVYFYNVTAQVKALIDRCQMFWARKYRLGLLHPRAAHRQGILLSVAASGGKRLFEGMELTARYFFDAISMPFSHGLTRTGVDEAGDIHQSPAIEWEIQALADRVTAPLRDENQLVLVSLEDDCLGQAAGALALQQTHLQVHTAGVTPTLHPDPAMVRAMAIQGLDLKYARPRALEELLRNRFQHIRPRWVGIIGADTPLDLIPGVVGLRLDLPPLSGDGQAWSQAVKERMVEFLKKLG